MAKGEGKVVAQNKKASHDYTIVETIEAGIQKSRVFEQLVSTSRMDLPKSKMGKSGSAMFILLPMRKAISGTKTQSVVANSCCIRSKFKSWSRRLKEQG